MADIGNSTVYIGSPDWYIGDPESYAAEADYLDPRSAQFGLNARARFVVMGAYSPDPDGDILFYDWEITRAPPKSLSSLYSIEDNATFEVDAIGVYVISVLVSGANGGARQPLVSFIAGQPASVAYNSGIEYDVSWIWRTLPDFWSTLEQADRVKIEAIWASFQALASAELMDVFNTKDSIALGSLQADVFRKWQSFDLTLDISPARVLFGADTASIEAVSPTEARIRLVKAQQRYDAKLIKADALLVQGVIPQTFDIGRPARVTNVSTGFIADTRITGVGKTSAGVSVFAIPPQDISPADLPAAYDLRLFVPGYLSDVVVRVDGEYYLSSSGGDGYLDVTVPQTEHLTGATIPPQVWVTDAELLGVSVGDLLEAEVVDLTSSKRITLYATAVAVFGSIVAVNVDASLRDYLSMLYDADTVNVLLEDMHSVGWGARHKGSWLDGQSIYQVGVGGLYAKNIALRGVKLYRRKRVLLADDIRTLFRLTTATTRMTLTDEGAATSTGNVVAELPLELYENLDFYVRRTADYGYRLRSVTRNTFAAEGYDFELAGIEPGQVLSVTTGLATGTYTILSIDGASVLVEPLAPTDFADAEFYIRSDNAYLELRVPALYERRAEKLWAEYAVYDNGPRIEQTFGSAIGLSRDFWEALNNKSTYRDAVATIIKSRVSASTIEALDDVVSLSLGIPVAPFRSIVRDIDNEYRVSDTGEPLEAHVVLEEVTTGGALTGRISTHNVSAASGTRLGSTSGLAMNPSTGAPYRVGDVIEQYASIGEGVRIIDLYTANRTFVLNDVIDRHRFAVLIDVDSTASLASNPSKLTLMQSLISETKPSYTTFFIRLLKFLVDEIHIEDDVFFKLRTRFIDNPYHHRGPANVFDDQIPGTSDRDEAPMLPLTTWFPRDGLFSDANPETGEVTLTSTRGGFLDPTDNSMGAEFESTGVFPWLEAGDGVEVVSMSQVNFDIVSVVSDTELRIKTRYIEDRLSLIDLPTTPQRFFAYRLLSDGHVRAAIDVPLEGARIKIDCLGQSSTNFGHGDVLTLAMDDGTRSGRLRILETDRDPISGVVTITTYPRVQGIVSGIGTVRVFRELIRDRRITVPIGATTLAFSVFLELTDHAYTLGLDVGDIIEVEGTTGARIVGISDTRVFTDAPLPPLAEGTLVTCSRPNTNEGADDLDEQELAVGSSVYLIRHGIQVDMTVGVITTDFEFKPGDIVYFPSVSIDLGEGQGVLRVCSKNALGQYETNSVKHPQRLFGHFTKSDRCSVIRQDALHSDYFVRSTSNTITWGELGRGL